jgi:hypothetical protein
MTFDMAFTIRAKFCRLASRCYELDQGSRPENAVIEEGAPKRDELRRCSQSSRPAVDDAGNARNQSSST